jgi:putative flippase GtrA
MLERQWFRFLIAGAWNSLVGWAIFSALWLILRDQAGLWLIGIAAHLLATTQAFIVQRRLVFRNTSTSVVAQYFRFQSAYLFQLAVGVGLITALASQGMHPMAAQPLVMVLLAFCSFFIGRDFVFVHDADARRVPWGQAVRSMLLRHRWTLALFALSMAAFERFFGARFYTSTTHVGHDFALAGLTLLEGRFWILSNGFAKGLLDPPWFTPAWCAGGALFTDPQAAFYSTVQLFALWFDPFTASHLNALLFAAIGFWGSFALARKVFGWTPAGSAVFGVLAMANASMPLRTAVGELGFQPLYLWPLLALALCWPAGSHWRSRLAWPGLGAGLCLTAWLHAGFAGVMVPTFLGVMLLCLVLVPMGRVRLEILLARAMLGGVLAIVLNVSKLYEAASLMRNFPRDFYGMPGFPSFYDAIVASFMALVLPSEWTTDFGLRRLTGMPFTVLPHEWALEFGAGAVALALTAWLALVLARKRSASVQASQEVASPAANPQPARWLQALLWLGIGALVILPPLLLWNNGPVREALKQIPILNSTAWPMRWIVIYLPVFQWLLAWPVQQLIRHMPDRYQAPALVSAMVVIWLGPMAAPTGYYTDPRIQTYDPKPVLRAHAQSLQSGPIPIDRIELSAERGIERNDAMLEGASQAQCYNPLYGYRLEAFPQKERLHPGPVLASDHSGQSLIFNPACLVHPAANACKPGDGFRMDDPAQRKAAEDFVARRPFEWQRPWIGKLLSWISQGLFWLILSLLLMQLWKALLTAASLRGTGR